MIVGKDMLLPNGQKIVLTKEQKGIRHGFIFDEIYRQLICVIASDDIDKAYEAFGFRVDDTENFIAQVTQSKIDVRQNGEMYKRSCTFITFKISASDPITYGVLCHEAEHVRQFVWNIIGETENSGGETKAYYIHWVVDSVIKLLGVPNKIDFSSFLSGK